MARRILMVQRRMLRVVLLVSLTILVMHYTRNAVETPQVSSRIVRWSRNLTAPDSRRIFFHETSGGAWFNIRQSCAIESAARENPSRPVQLFLHRTEDVDESHSFYSSVLNGLDNLIVFLVNTTEYVAGSRLEEWYNKGVWRKSPHKVVHLSDYIRVLTLKMGGGLYMDLDYVTVRPLDEDVLKNFFSTECGWGYAISISAFHFDGDHWAADEWLQRLQQIDYRPEVYDWHGLPLLTKMLVDKCALNMSNLMSVEERCPDIKIMACDAFTPIGSSTPNQLFEPASRVLNDVLLSKTYAVHTWNSVSKYFSIDFNSDEVYAKIARTHCPLTVAAAASWL